MRKAILLAALAIFAVGCTTNPYTGEKRASRTVTSGAGGAAAGAAAGAVIGAIAGNAGKGAAIGAASGAALLADHEQRSAPAPVKVTPAPPVAIPGLAAYRDLWRRRAESLSAT